MKLIKFEFEKVEDLYWGNFGGNLLILSGYSHINKGF